MSALWLAACAGEAPARPQLLLSIDTTAPVPGQLAVDPTLSPMAVVDSLRIDVLGPRGEVLDVLEISAPEERDWPISFGVVASAGEPPVELRLRAFRAAEANPSSVLGTSGEPRGVLEPVAEVAIDRLVRLSGPESGVKRVEIVLDGDCMGRRVRFGRDALTCVDAARLEVDPTQGVEPFAQATPSRAGTWATARSVGCRAKPPAGTRCIPGGFSVLGDRDLVGLGVGFQPSAPLRPALLDPFFMDETEFSVARYEALRGSLTGLPAASGTIVQPSSCTSSRGDAASLGLPLNCVPLDTAQELCELSGGSLPTEAQWEHAARGRQGRTYPWEGSAAVPDCAAGLGSSEPKPIAAVAPGCADLRDVSRDGVFDLLGNLMELTLDANVSFGADCWSLAPVLHEPRCVDPLATGTIVRGSAWGYVLSSSHLALRRSAAANEQNVFIGFRCVYPDG